MSFYKGEFKNNQKHGLGEQVIRNKKVLDQVWDKGLLISEKENIIKK